MSCKYSEEEIQDMILQVLAEHPEGLTQEEICFEMEAKFGVVIDFNEEGNS